MKISTQKKVLYVPIVNFFVIVFSWLAFYRKHNGSAGDFLKTALKIIGFCVLITVPRILVAKLVGILWLDTLLFWISVPFYLFIPAYFAWKDQENHSETVEREGENV